MRDFRQVIHPSRSRTRMRHAGRQGGFSLIEVSIVLVILSVVLGGGLTTLSTMRDKQQKQKTNLSLDKVRDALIWYAASNGFLPCPDVGVDASNTTQVAFDGVGDADGAGNCRLSYGVLPWEELGLPRYDNWNNYFTYHLAPVYHSAITCTTTGNLVVRQDTDAGTLLAEQLAVVVVSHGPNGAGSIVPTPAGSPGYITRRPVNGQDPNAYENRLNSEAENADIETSDDEDDLHHADPTDNSPATQAAHAGHHYDQDFQRPLYIQNAGDDQLLYISPLLLKTKLMESGRNISCVTTTTTSIAASTSVPTTTTSVPTTTTSVATTTSVPTTTTSVATTTTSVPTTTTSVPTTTTSVPTTTVSTTTTSVATTTVPTTTTSVATTSVATTTVPTTTTSVATTSVATTTTSTSTTTTSIPTTTTTSTSTTTTVAPTGLLFQASNYNCYDNRPSIMTQATGASRFTNGQSARSSNPCLVLPVTNPTYFFTNFTSSVNLSGQNEIRIRPEGSFGAIDCQFDFTNATTTTCNGGYSVTVTKSDAKTGTIKVNFGNKNMSALSKFEVIITKLNSGYVDFPDMCLGTCGQ
ncbi:MAG: type II secretion system protein [Magnetococcales bacterium]|nr:type II secretion system protein [Magnetococcales bacterium]